MQNLLGETYDLKKQVDNGREELSHSLYQYDASLRVITKLIKERDSIIQEINELKDEFKFIAGQYITVRITLEGKEIRRSYSICSSPEKLKIQKKFDVILNMEIVEHVEDINFFINSCSKLLKKNGLMFVATLNKTLKSYMFAIVGAEYVLRWLPIGTHDWEKFVRPEDLKKILSKNNLKLEKLDGMNFNIIKDEWSVSSDTSINYIVKSIKL